jgi:hypothetical protein
MSEYRQVSKQEPMMAKAHLGVSPNDGTFRRALKRDGGARFSANELIGAYHPVSV